jgi:hypothetical protein
MRQGLVSKRYIQRLNVARHLERQQRTVGLDGKGVATQRLDFGDGGFGRLLAAVAHVVDDDLLSALAELQRNRLAQSSRASGHEAHLGIRRHHVEATGVGS